MKVITISNEKGGVGKTTISTHISAGLALRGYKVVLIDGDPQGNATSTMRLNKQGGVYDAFIRYHDWSDVLKLVHPDMYSPPDTRSEGQLYCLPGNIETRNVTTSLSSRHVMRQRMNELAEMFDYVIWDTGPTPSLLNEAILLATDYVLLPTECTAFSALEGTPDSLQFANNAKRELNHGNLEGAQILGIIPNKYRERLVGHQQYMDYLRQEYDDLVWEPLPHAVAVEYSQTMQEFLYGYAPEHQVTQMFWQMTDKIITGVTV